MRPDLVIAVPGGEVIARPHVEEASLISFFGITDPSPAEYSPDITLGSSVSASRGLGPKLFTVCPEDSLHNEQDQFACSGCDSGIH